MKNIFDQFYIAADHGGFELKQKIIKELNQIPWRDLGTKTADSVDYPDYAEKLTKEIKSDKTCGVLICGSGQGMVIRANREKHIRAALCWSEDVTKLARQHNNANVICLGARTTDNELAVKLVQIFINTAFEGGRHARRVEKLYC